MSQPALDRHAHASRTLDVSVSHSPQPTVFARMCTDYTGHVDEARRRGRFGVAEHVFPLRSYRHPDPHGCVPDALVPIVSRPDVPVAEQVAALRSYPEHVLMAELAEMERHTRAWEHAARDPRRWLNGYADASWAYWQHLQPTWQRARHLMDRETERIGVAAVRGGLHAALNTLNRRLMFDGSAFWLDRARRFPLDGRRVLLVPGLIPDNGLMIHHSNPRVLSIAYAVRGHGSISTPVAAPRHDRLALVLGSSRAAILRLVEVPRTVSELAAELTVTPAAITRHCDQLKQAGLITRERRGKAVQVSLSEDGAEFVELMSTRTVTSR